MKVLVDSSEEYMPDARYGNTTAVDAWEPGGCSITWEMGS